MSTILKFISGSVIADSALGDRQIRVIANSGKSDRVKDVLVAKGCQLENYKANPIVLANHDHNEAIGNFSPEIKGDSVEGIITFAPAGISVEADKYCGLYKAEVMKTVSVGFTPLEAEPIKDGGLLFKKWELMELSCVAIPCDPGAVVTARALDVTASIDAEGIASFFEKNSEKIQAMISAKVDKAKLKEGKSVVDVPKIKSALIEKGLWNVACLAHLLEELGWQHISANVESEIEGDASKVPAMLGEALQSLAAAFLAMVAEETQELLDGCALDIPPEIAMDESLSASTKQWRAAFRKAGRVLSEENSDHLDGAVKCLGKAADLVKGLEGLQGHLDEAAEHVKCVMNKNKDPQSSEETESPNDSDMELAFAAARRKRMVAVNGLRSVP
jgi:hypothetical protein